MASLARKISQAAPATRAKKEEQAIDPRTVGSYFRSTHYIENLGRATNINAPTLEEAIAVRNFLMMVVTLTSARRGGDLPNMRVSEWHRGIANESEGLFTFTVDEHKVSTHASD